MQTPRVYANDKLAFGSTAGTGAHAAQVKTHESTQAAKAVIEALSDPRWDFRSAEGIARQLNLPVSEVAAILRSHVDAVRESPALDANGRELFAPRRKGTTLRELISAARMYITNSTH